MPQVSNRRQARRGAAAVEMAFVLPIMLTLIIGMIDFGWVMYANTTVSEAARCGARYAIVNGSLASSTTKCGPTANDSKVQTVVKNNVPGLDSTQVSVTSSWPNSDNSAGNPVTVTASYTYQTFIGKIVGFSPSVTVTGSSTMTITH